jgi:hypothetical protein
VIWVYCPCCYRHWQVEPMMGQWMVSCTRCEHDCLICWDHQAPCLARVERACDHTYVVAAE